MGGARPGYGATVPGQECPPLSDPTSDLTFRPASASRSSRRDDTWEAVVREELRKLRRRSPPAPRVVPAGRRRKTPDTGADRPKPA
jgi:hypothetical protein